MQEYILIDSKDLKNISKNFTNLIFITYDEAYKIISKKKHTAQQTQEHKDIAVFEKSYFDTLEIDKDIETKNIYMNII